MTVTVTVVVTVTVLITHNLFLLHHFRISNYFNVTLFATWTTTTRSEAPILVSTTREKKRAKYGCVMATLSHKKMPLNLGMTKLTTAVTDGQKVLSNSFPQHVEKAFGFWEQFQGIPRSTFSRLFQVPNINKYRLLRLILPAS